MGIGASIFLIAIGAILTFAIDAQVQGIDVAAVGVILMIAGALGLVLTIFVFGRRGGAPTTGAVVEERRVYDDRV